MKGNLMTDMTLPRPKDVPPLDFETLAAKLKEEEVTTTGPARQFPIAQLCCVAAWLPRLGCLSLGAWIASILCVRRVSHLSWAERVSPTCCMQEQERAAEEEAKRLASMPLPAGWETAVSRSTGQTYYVNTQTGATQYEFPDGPAEVWKVSAHTLCVSVSLCLSHCPRHRCMARAIRTVRKAFGTSLSAGIACRGNCQQALMHHRLKYQSLYRCNQPRSRCHANVLIR